MLNKEVSHTIDVVKMWIMNEYQYRKWQKNWQYFHNRRWHDIETILWKPLVTCATYSSSV